MRFCYECGRTTPGVPRFCNSCGRSYDLKVCPRFHENPRTAEACARCASRELSRPQPKISSGWRLVEWLTRCVTGIALAVFTAVLIAAALTKFIMEQRGFEKLLFSVALLALLWCFWSLLPYAFQRLVRRSLLRRRRRLMKSLD